jgi:hypothetical protein
VTGAFQPVGAAQQLEAFLINVRQMFDDIIRTGELDLLDPIVLTPLADGWPVARADLDSAIAELRVISESELTRVGLTDVQLDLKLGGFGRARLRFSRAQKPQVAAAGLVVDQLDPRESP